MVRPPSCFSIRRRPAIRARASLSTLFASGGWFGDMDLMRPLIAIAVLFALCGCQTRVKTPGSSMSPADPLAVERVLAGYARYFPEARRVLQPANILDYFSGIYGDNGPSGWSGFRGRNLYLFPDGRFILTEWADIMRETSLMEGIC